MQRKYKMIKPVNLFHTPHDWEELAKWIHLHPVEERAQLTTAAAMAWNLAAKVRKESK
tara:strand:+ start:539 stop:712 length:174 start_codon:yes stop_codon:yes gene_type:complete